MVKLFNNLNSIQPIKIQDRFGKVYTIFIESKKSTEIEGYQITNDVRNKIKSGALIDLTNSANTESSSSLVVSEIVHKVMAENSEPVINQEIDEQPVGTEEDKSKESDNELDESNVNVLKLEDSNGPYICEICGNEYASSRGLELHKSKSHK